MQLRALQSLSAPVASVFSCFFERSLWIHDETLSKMQGTVSTPTNIKDTCDSKTTHWRTRGDRRALGWRMVVTALFWDPDRVLCSGLSCRDRYKCGLMSVIVMFSSSFASFFTPTLLHYKCFCSVSSLSNAVIFSLPDCADTKTLTSHNFCNLLTFSLELLMLAFMILSDRWLEIQYISTLKVLNASKRMT